MTRNSADRLEHWIGRAREFADEVTLLVDVSSTDNTAKVASAFADKVKVVEHPPINELAMDYGLRQASGEWLLWLDDDEFMAPGFAQRVESLMANPFLTHYYLPWRWLVPTENDGAGWLRNFPWYPALALRLIRNVGSVYYHRGRLHSPIEVSGYGEVLDDDDSAVYHFDFLWHNRALRERKMNRYRAHPPAPSCEEYYLYEDYASTLVIEPVDQEVLDQAVPPSRDDPAPATAGETIPLPEPDGPVVPLAEMKAAIAGHWAEADVFHAEYVDHTTPRLVLGNRGYTVELIIRNTSEVPWRNTGIGPPPRVYLSYHWSHPQYGMLLRDGDISMFKTVVAPGVDARIAAGLWTPYEPGTYQLQWDLRSEDRAWFSERGVEPLCVEVTVEDRERLLPRPRHVATLPWQEPSPSGPLPPSRSLLTLGGVLRRAADRASAVSSRLRPGSDRDPAKLSLVALEREGRVLRERIAQRDEALANLNRRLHRAGSEGSAELSRRLAEAEAELLALRATKTFRYTSVLRRGYRKVVLRRQ